MAGGGVHGSEFAGVATKSVLGLALGLLACKPEPSAEIPEPVEPPAIVVEAPRIAVAATCTARSSRGSLALIPDVAEFVMHFGPREIMGSTLWSLLEPSLAQDAEWLSAQQPFDSCGVPLRSIEHILVGTVTGGEFVAILIGPSIGRPDVAQCVIKAVQTRAGDAQTADVQPWIEDPSVATIEFTDGRAYLFADDVLAVATTTWADEVGRLGRCEGPAAIDGHSRELLVGLDIDAPVWAVGRVDPAVADPIVSAAGINNPGVHAFAVSLALDSGASLQASVRVRDPSTAASMATQLRTTMDSFGPVLGPQVAAIVSRTVVESVNASVQLRTSMTVAEILALATM